MKILKRGLSSYSSPLFLINKSGSNKEKRLLVDFRILNKRIKKYNVPFPLIRESIQTIGASECTMFSTLDLKSAYHSLSIAEECQDYVGVTSYYGGDSFKFLKLPQGLSLSPSVFSHFMSGILSEIPDFHKWGICMMDDILLYGKCKKEHRKNINQILDLMSKHGLKLSPQKMKLFRTKVTYLGHVLVVKNGKPCITAQKSKCQAIIDMPRPRNLREVRRYCGAIGYLRMYLPELHKVLKPIYDLTKTKEGAKKRKKGTNTKIKGKGTVKTNKPKVNSRKVKIEWGPEQEQAFKKIKELLCNPPILHMPTEYGKIKIYVDTSIYCTGSAVYQVIDSQERLIGYHSKALFPSAKNYGIIELEATGLLINFIAFRHLLKTCSFEAFTIKRWSQ